jgi:lipopolysaccharide transport system ATP-binding protein
VAEAVIRVSDLGKRYRLGSYVGDKTLRDSFTRLYTSMIGQFSKRRRPVSTAASDASEQLSPSSAAANKSEYIWALKNISFEIPRGEAVGIIGRNGSGKSTLLKVLSRITAPSEGYAEIRGRVGSLLEVGTGFHPDLTGRENIYLNGAILGMRKSEIEARFRDIVDFAEVGRFLDTPVKRYSSGMYVRLAFAVAAHLEPEILIVDEVLAVGDARFQQKCLGKMGSVANEGRTILFVSHNMNAVRRLCSSVVLLESGRMVEYGPTDQIIGKYLVTSGSGESSTFLLPPGQESAPGRGSFLRVYDEHGTPQSHFFVGERWTIAFEFEITVPLTRAVAAVSLMTIDNIAIVTYLSASKDVPAGKYKVVFHCDIPLSVCEVQLVASLFENDHRYYFESSGMVTIAERVKDSEVHRGPSTGLLASTARPPIESIV